MERTSKVEFDIDEISSCEGGQSTELTAEWLRESKVLEERCPHLLKGIRTISGNIWLKEQNDDQEKNTVVRSVRP